MGARTADTPAVATDHEAAARVPRRFRQVSSAVRSHAQQVEKCIGIGGAQV